MARRAPLTARGRWLALLAATLAGPAARGIDLEPGAYTALPPGRSALGIYLVHVERDARYAGGDRLPGDVSLDTDTVQARFLHYLQAGGLTVAPGFILSCGQTRAGGDLAALGEARGCADPIAGAIFWVVNRPEKRNYFGITPYLSVPVGQYDRNQALNLGENRWKGGVNSGVIAPLTGKVLLDFTGDVLWHGINDDYLGANCLEQEPIANVQIHLRYQIDPLSRLSASYLHDWGGETAINGVAQDNEKNQGRFRLGAARFLDPHHQLQLEAGADTRVENGYRENLRVILRYVWLP